MRQFLSKKSLLVIVALLIIAPSLITIFFLAGNSYNGTDIDNGTDTEGSGFTSADSDGFISMFTDRSNVIISQGVADVQEIAGSLRGWEASLDGSRAAALAGFSASGIGGELWFVDASGSRMIEDDVVLFLISDTGEGVLYMADYDIENSTASLFLYNSLTGTTDKIAYDIAAWAGLEAASISPDGRTVVFMRGTDRPELEIEGFVSINGQEPVSLGESTFPLAVADNGAYIYYMRFVDMESGWSLYVRNDMGETELMTSWLRENLLLSNDRSVAIIPVSDGAYISRSGSIPETLGVGALRNVVVPNGMPTRDLFAGITVFAVAAFENTAIIGNEGFIFIESNGEMRAIAGHHEFIHAAFISGDGDSLLYLNNEWQIVKHDMSVPDFNRTVYGSDVLDFVASYDGTIIHYIDHSNQLWTLGVSAEPTMIASNVSEHHFVVSHDGNIVYFLVNHCWELGGELYMSTGGGDAVRVDAGTNVVSIWTAPSGAFFITADNALYRSGADGVFTLIHSQIDTWGFVS
ncbi:MAG: hypothetical protein FWD05_02100 [Oscillospiraceae bacterium]|nr:hypothetical protein [Oscillospiraceae bacterium]